MSTCRALHSDLDASSFPGADRYLNSYESLPPNFSLVQNMVAGAFAGIAVSGLADQIKHRSVTGV